MPARKLPGDEYPDPMSLLRDPAWETNWPTLILRGIHDVILRERKAGRGSLKEAYIKAFNVVIFGLHRRSHPRRIEVNDGIITLTPEGQKREEMSKGLMRLNKKAQEHYGDKTKAQMRIDTLKKMKQLRLWITELAHDLPDNQPVSSPIQNASQNV